MKRLILILLGLAANVANAENLFVRSGASGANTGANWTDAWPNFASVSWGGGAGQVGAGDTLWIAGGTYSGTLSVNASGDAANRIYIKRALASESACTSAAGWNAGYDATVNIPLNAANSAKGIAVNGSYVTIDGGVAYLGFTFVIDWTGVSADQGGGGAVSLYGSGINSIVIKNMLISEPSNAVQLQANQVNGLQLGAQTATAANQDVTVQYVEFNNLVNGIHAGRNDGLVIEYCYFHDCHYKGTDANIHTHGNVAYWHMEDTGPHNLTFRYNRLYDNDPSEGIFLAVDNASWTGRTTTHYYVYGNRSSGASGAFTKTYQFYLGQCNATDVQIINNSFNGDNMPIRYTDGQNLPQGRALNNIFYNINPNSPITITESDYNVYSGSDARGEANSVTIGSYDPYNNSAANNYTLKTGTVSGLVLSAPFTSDPSAVTRGGDGVWDRGAFEFGGTAAAPVITSNNIVCTNGVAFTYSIAASSANSYDATNLFTGLVVNTNTGVISGTPSGAAETNRVIGLKAVNDTGTTWQTVLGTQHPAAGVLATYPSSIAFGDKITNSTTQATITYSNSGPIGTSLSVTVTNATAPFSILNGYTNDAALSGTETLVAVLQFTPTAVATNLGSVQVIADGVNVTNDLTGAGLPLFTSTNITLAHALLRAPVVSNANNYVTCTNSNPENYTASGSASFFFSSNSPGQITLQMSFIATNTANDSVFVTIDENVSNTNIFDAPASADFDTFYPVTYRTNAVYGSSATRTWLVAAGDHEITVHGRETQMHLRELNVLLTPTIGVMTITSGDARGTNGVAFTNYTILTDIAANAWGATNLPSGLSRATNYIYGTPTTAVTNTVGLFATNSGGYYTNKEVTFTIKPAEGGEAVSSAANFGTVRIGQ